MIQAGGNEGAGEVIVRHCIITNELGLHLRPAGLLVKTANRYESAITIEKDGLVADGKSIIQITTLNAAHNSTITIKASGPDARQALDALGALISSNFEEPQNNGNRPAEPPA
jgi:phosphotransferase system HPr (HPr) family protein